MAKVTGLGGMFFKAKDMDKMKAFYRDRLGVPIGEEGYWVFQWRDNDNPKRVGGTVWSLFPADTDYFAPGAAPFMVNFRVDDLAGLLAKLKAEGVTVIDKVEELEYGRFGWIMDPEGNKIELWEPIGEVGQEPKA